MIRRIFSVLVLTLSVASAAEVELRSALETTYSSWRDSIVRRDVALWQRVTAEHRKVEVRNRIVSEKEPFPAAIFKLPTPPPKLQGLKFLEAKQNGATAKASYFGKVDFGIGGEPSDNLLVISFVHANGSWLYDRADFVNLVALPEVEKELAAGDLKYLKETPEAQPNGKVPPTPMVAREAKYAAKVYVFCPGREVEVLINKISRHRFANAKEAEVVIGGAVDGPNELQFAVRKLQGGTGKEAMTLRVYLKSEIPGVNPLKIYQYQIDEGGAPKPFATETFNLTPEIASKVKRK